MFLGLWESLQYVSFDLEDSHSELLSASEFSQAVQ